MHPNNSCTKDPSVILSTVKCNRYASANQPCVPCLCTILEVCHDQLHGVNVWLLIKEQNWKELGDCFRHGFKRALCTMVAKQTTVQSQEQKHALMKPNDLAKTTPPYIYPIPWNRKSVEHRNILLTTTKAWYTKAVRIIKTLHHIFDYEYWDRNIWNILGA